MAEENSTSTPLAADTVTEQQREEWRKAANHFFGTLAEALSMAFTLTHGRIMQGENSAPPATQQSKPRRKQRYNPAMMAAFIKSPQFQSSFVNWVNKTGGK